MFRQCFLWITIVLIASAGWAQADGIGEGPALTPAADSAVIPTQSSSDLSSAELDAAQAALVKKASDPATFELTREEIERLQSDPQIQEVGTACCMADCWVFASACMDACNGNPDQQACRNQCRAERRQCLDDC